MDYNNSENDGLNLANTNNEHTNRFIFSDDYYDNMPSVDDKNDVAKKVTQLGTTANTNNQNKDLFNISKQIDSSNDNIQKTNNFDQLVNSNYDNDTNTFDFFGHNANTNILESKDDSHTELTSDNDTTSVSDNDSNSDIVNNDILQPEKPVSNNEVVHIDMPVFEDNTVSPLPTNGSVYGDLPTIDENSLKQEFVKPEEIKPVDVSGVDNNIIDSIVDYNALIPEVNNDNSDKVGNFIVNSDPSVKVENKKPALTNFMDQNQAMASLDIDTGFDKDLEAKLMKQKAIEEEEKRKNNPDLQDYMKYSNDDDNAELVYKAGGKSIIRYKQKNNAVSKPAFVPTNQDIVNEPNEDKTENIPEEKKEPHSIEEAIEDILNIPNYDELVVNIDEKENPGVRFGNFKVEEPKVALEGVTTVYDEKKDNFDYDQNFENVEVIKSTLLDELKEKADSENRISILARYGEDFCSKDYITNPAIGRAEEIKQLILILLTPEKSGILIGKPGIGKTSIVEGLAYQLQRNNVPDALKGYRIVSVKTASLLGSLPTGETRLQTLVDELKTLDKIILFIDEIHMLIGATNESSLDFANMFKESLGRGSIKVIGATTTEEYERYILRDKAFVRRFQKVEVEEPDRTHTIKILMGTLPKIEKNTGAKLKYSQFIQSEIMAFIVDITTEYKRIYGIGSRYPDICLTLLAQAFSQAVFANRKEVNILDIRKAIENSKNIYPDVIKKELVNFDLKFKDIIKEEELN